MKEKEHAGSMVTSYVEGNIRAWAAARDAVQLLARCCGSQLLLVELEVLLCCSVSTGLGVELNKARLELSKTWPCLSMDGRPGIILI